VPVSFFQMPSFLILRISVLYFRLNFFFSSRRRHTISKRDWSSDVCSSDLCFLWTSSSTTIFSSNFFSYFNHSRRTSSNCNHHYEIGRASCRERVELSVGSGTLQKNSNIVIATRKRQ